MGTHTRPPFQRRHSCHLSSPSSHQDSFIRSLQSIHQRQLPNPVTHCDDSPASVDNSIGSDNGIPTAEYFPATRNCPKLSRRRRYTSDGKRKDAQDEDEGRRRVIQDADPFFLIELPSLPFRGPILKNPMTGEYTNAEQNTSSRSQFVDHPVQSPSTVALTSFVKRRVSHNNSSDEVRNEDGLLASKPSVTGINASRLSRRHSCHGTHGNQIQLESTISKAAAVEAGFGINPPLPPPPPFSRTSSQTNDPQRRRENQISPKQPLLPTLAANKSKNMRDEGRYVSAKTTNQVPKCTKRRSMVETKTNKAFPAPVRRNSNDSGECVRLTQRYVRQVIEGNRVDESEKQPSNRGFRYDYELGDTARRSSHMIIAEDEDSSYRAVSGLQCHDFVFVRRSNGKGWTYSIMAYRSLCENGREEDTKLDECMLFVMDKEGSTKMIKKKHWGECIRPVSMVGVV